MTATRRALYELARWIPMQRLAPLFGLSDSGLGKIYRWHWIDRASRGDWARQKHGHLVSRPQFRLAPAEAGEVVHFGSTAGVRDGPRDRRDRELITLLERDARASPVTIPESLRNAHPLVRRGAKASARRQYLGQENLPGAAVDTILRVPKPQDHRARRLLSALFDAVEKRGIRIVVDLQDARPEPRLEVLGMRFELRLTYHRTRRVRPELQRPVDGAAPGDEPSRDLVLQATVVGTTRRQRWGGAGRAQLEDHVDRIPAALIAMSAAEREARRLTSESA